MQRRTYNGELAVAQRCLDERSDCEERRILSPAITKYPVGYPQVKFDVSPPTGIFRACLKINRTAFCCLGFLFAFLAGGRAIADTVRADPAETRRLHELFDADWQWRMRTFPERATYAGDHRYGGRLNDRSREKPGAR